VNKCQNFTNAPEEYWNPLFVLPNSCVTFGVTKIK
jgi:hypothetical protein